MEEERHSPIPIPRGSYNLNFDEIDEFTNPFATKSIVGQSPPVSGNVNPFQSVSKMGHSPPINSNNNIYDIEDPFKSKNKISSSPPSTTHPKSPAQVSEESSTNPLEPEQEPFKKGNKISRSSEEPQEGVMCTEQQGLSNEEDSKPKDSKEESKMPDSEPKDDKTKMKPPSKKPAGKKGIKKPKIRSKFKPPENFGAQPQGDDEIQIFVPKKESSPSPPREEEPVKVAMPVTEEPDSKQETTNEEVATGSGDVESSNQMAQSLEMMHDFGAAEMPDSDENEGFVP